MNLVSSATPRLIDIGANLTDSCFRGIYRDKRAHEDDFGDVLERAQQVGLKKIIITSGTRQDTHDAIELIKEHPNYLSTTVGVHPTRCSQEFEPEGDETKGEEYLRSLLEIAQKHTALNVVDGKRGPIVAIGEFGLDYDRLHFCSKEIQLKWFERQFELSESTKLPLFLHMRNAEEDFIEVVKKNRHRFTHGVVHSYTGENPTHLKSLLDLNLYIGVNGCSLKTQQNLDIVKTIPLDRLMIETDAPYCDIKPSGPAAKYLNLKATPWPSVKKEKWKKGAVVKSRNEPCYIRQVLDVIAGVKGEDVQKVADQIYKNTCLVFFPWLLEDEKL
eukprot:TRINITY_DN3176_c0_g1_i1.p1 TRINITY_DN3176_c0_g1~~TRINITY_DN3176_c0_g1_i1.p1  ORF type:complete len:347 (+),score=55.14 TRINITY_DN3176_c0_g1_i1:54-1043(+)